MHHYKLRKFLFIAFVLWGASVFWFAKHPPMGDLAQHAGQISLWRDLILGTSEWKEYVRINLATPYLIGYGLTLPLAFIFPISTALKIVLSCAYILFVWIAVRVRVYLNGDSRLDWLFIPSFFGFAMGWGFMTFLVAAPLALAMIYAGDIHARTVKLKSSVFVFLIGLALLMSHGLAFCFGWAVVAALILVHQRQPRKLLMAFLPLVILLIPFAGYGIYSQKLKFELQGVTEPSRLVLDYSLSRFTLALRYSLTGTDERFFTVIGFVLVLMPWVMGFRIDFKNPSRYAPFAVAALTVVFAPQLAIDTWGLFPRYAIFLLPTYAWMFYKPQPVINQKTSASRMAAGEIVLAVICAGFLLLQCQRFIAFDHEEADFRKLESVSRPGQRALALVYDRRSVAVHHSNMYAHTVAWYQAEKNGFVDFNFAWHPPQVVRFKQGKTPMIHIDFEAHPEQFNWRRDNGNIYTYFYLRGTPPNNIDPFDGAQCRPALVMQSGEWMLYERRICE